jgi:hypothetical protein
MTRPPIDDFIDRVLRDQEAFDALAAMTDRARFIDACLTQAAAWELPLNPHDVATRMRESHLAWLERRR